MNKLIPNFEERVKAAENINSFCAPVCLSTCFISAGQSDLRTSCKQVPTMCAAMTQGGSKLRSLIGSTTVGIPMQDCLLVLASLPTRRSNVASPMMLQAASFAQSIMIGTIQCTCLAYLFLSLQFPSTPHLVYVPISETLLLAITTHVDSSFVVCTSVRPETLWTQRRDF